MSRVLAECFIIDIASIRGTKEEEKLFDFDSHMDQLSECILEDVALSTKIVIGMIIKIMSSKGNSTIILFSRINNERSQNLWKNVGLCFEEHNVIQLIGQQSLFYFLGRKMDEFSHVSWVTKEKMFFSKDFIKTFLSLEGWPEWRIFTLSRFWDLITVNKASTFRTKEHDLLGTNLVNAKSASINTNSASDHFAEDLESPKSQISSQDTNQTTESRNQVEEEKIEHHL